MTKQFGNWQAVNSISSRTYTCGFCGNVVASAIGYYADNNRGRIYVCPHCNGPSVFDAAGLQLPGVAPGAEVRHLPSNVDALYREARNCVAATAYTGAVLCARKLLMNIAVAEGASPGKSFVTYVEYLANGGYVPPNGKGWVNHIRNKGNEATHEIVEMTKADAEDLITFAEMLLKFIYEFPNRVPVPAPRP